MAPKDVKKSFKNQLFSNTEISSLFFLCMCVCLVACHRQDALRSTQLLHLNIVADPVSLDPRLVQCLPDLTLARQLYEGLMRLDAEGIPQPALAESVELSVDHLTYTFHLREAYWANGDPVTAHDVVRSWSQALDPTFPCNYAHMLYPIKHARGVRAHTLPAEALGLLAVDDRTLVVCLENPTPYFLELTAFPTLFPVNSYHKNGGSAICSGPFMLKEWQLSQKLMLEKNPTYWDAAHVYLDGMEIGIVADNTTESYLYRKGKLDWLGQPISQNIATELIAHLRTESTLRSYDIDGTVWLNLNVHVSPFDDPQLRTAFALAINRHEIITHLLLGHQQVATSPIPPSMALSSLPQFKDHDLERARELFATALQAHDWTICPPITLSYPNHERTAKIVLLIQQQWEQAFGIPITLHAMERTVYRQQLCSGLYQVGTGDWIADYHDPLSFLDLFKTCDMNQTGWCNSDYTALVEASYYETDPEMRLALLRQAEHMLIDEMPVIPLYHMCFDYTQQERVENVILSPLGIMDFKSTRIH